MPGAKGQGEREDDEFASILCLYTSNVHVHIAYGTIAQLGVAQSRQCISAQWYKGWLRSLHEELEKDFN